MIWSLYLPCTLLVLRRKNAGQLPAWLERRIAGMAGVAARHTSIRVTSPGRQGQTPTEIMPVSDRAVAVPWRSRLALALAGGLLVAWATAREYRLAPAHHDFGQVWFASGAILRGENAYQLIGPGLSYDWPWPFLYPLTAAIVTLPFASLPEAWAATLFMLIGGAVFAWTLMEHGYAPLAGFCSGALLGAAAGGAVGAAPGGIDGRSVDRCPLCREAYRCRRVFRRPAELVADRRRGCPRRDRVRGTADVGDRLAARNGVEQRPVGITRRTSARSSPSRAASSRCYPSFDGDGGKRDSLRRSRACL